jgi:membrane-bound metal-dependent hydrolase YbcI (DUF457 family)
MPGFTTHFVIGAATGAAVNTICQQSRRKGQPESKFDFGELCVCSLAAGAGACVPDLLEPADSPFHRKFFHSVVAAALVAYIISGKHTSRLGWPERLLLWMIGLGYLSHIVADARTPRSIPFF